MSDRIRGFTPAATVPRPRYDAKRQCAAPECITKLSTYNPSSVCWLHAPAKIRPIDIAESGDRKPPEPVSQVAHGTRSRYTYGCRCRACKAAAAADHRTRNARKAALV